jgi:hypothetical protein
MTETLTLLALAVPIITIVAAGWRRGEPVWVVGGSIAGYGALAIGLLWAASIGSGAVWAVLLAAFGVATWAQVEHLWWRRRSGR